MDLNVIYGVALLILIVFAIVSYRIGRHRKPIQKSSVDATTEKAIQKPTQKPKTRKPRKSSVDAIGE